ncbi:MAG: hypothetical protein NUV81_00730 [bacterium]|nr:hypothetical protein [bacterium]
MGKVCVACGSGDSEPMKPPHEAENCPDCGGEGTMQPEMDDTSMEEDVADDADDPAEAL